MTISAEMKAINDLFIQLVGISPAWKSAFNTEDQLTMAKRMWHKTFIEAGINTPEQIQCGIKKACRSTSSFFPSVGQFIDWCLDIPTNDEAYSLFLDYENGRIKELPPIVTAALQRIDMYTFRQMSTEKAQRVFKSAMSGVRDRVSSGDVLLGAFVSNKLEHKNND